MTCRSFLSSFALAVFALAHAGCFHVGQHFKDYILTSPGMDKAVTKVKAQYRGVRGTHGLWLSNDKGLDARLDFEMVSFPSRQQWEDLDLHPEEGEALKGRAIRHLRNYFGSEKQIWLVTLKTVAPDQTAHSYFLDAHVDGQPETIAEAMVSRGLYQVNADLAKSSGHKRLLKLQNAAQRSKIGIWKRYQVLNPHWRD